MTQDPIEIPPLETERMILRQLTEDDMEFIYEMFRREETNRYVADDAVTSMEEAKELYDAFISPKPYLFRLGLVLKDCGQLIGTVGFYGVNMEDYRAVLGADLLKEFWGYGYMTEAAKTLIDYGFEKMELNRIQASADADNTRSLALIKRLGLTPEGIMRQKDFYKGAFHDDVMFSILREEWEKLE